MKKDIENSDDIRLLVDSFYKKVVTDKTIGIFFTEVVLLDWQKHIPVMYAFWESLLLGTVAYKGNPMIKHIQLNTLKKIENIHFEQWLKLWSGTIDELFNGAKAEEAKNRATAISQLMLLKISKPDFIHYN